MTRDTLDDIERALAQSADDMIRAAAPLDLAVRVVFVENSYNGIAQRGYVTERRVVHLDTPKAKGKRARRRAKGKARA